MQQQSLPGTQEPLKMKAIAGDVSCLHCAQTLPAPRRQNNSSNTRSDSWRIEDPEEPTASIKGTEGDSICNPARGGTSAE